MSQSFEDIAKLFELSHNGRPMTALTADVAIYLDHSLAPHSAALTQALSAFLSVVPAAKLTWYGTESMTKDKPCSARALAIPKSWFREGSPPKVFRSLSVHDGDAHNSVAHCGLRISSRELEPGEQRPWEPSLVRFMLPAGEIWADPPPLVTRALQLANDFPLVSGHAGYCIERNFAYYAQPSVRAAYPLAMRFHGADVDDRLRDLQFAHPKTVSWLTLVGNPLLERIGGRDALAARVRDPQVTIHQAKHGVVLQAGEKPGLGDVNRGQWLPAYRSVYLALADLFASDFTPPFKLSIPEDPDSNVEKSEAWYRRFEQLR